MPAATASLVAPVNTPNLAWLFTVSIFGVFARIGFTDREKADLLAFLKSL